MEHNCLYPDFGCCSSFIVNLSLNVLNAISLLLHPVRHKRAVEMLSYLLGTELSRLPFKVLFETSAGWGSGKARPARCWSHCKREVELDDFQAFLPGCCALQHPCSINQEELEVAEPWGGSCHSQVFSSVLLKQHYVFNALYSSKQPNILCIITLKRIY